MLKPVIQCAIDSNIEVERELASVKERLTKLEAVTSRIDDYENMEDDECIRVIKTSSDKLDSVMAELSNLNFTRIDELQKELSQKDADVEEILSKEITEPEPDDDCATVATEEGIRIMTEEPELRKCGSWSVDEEVCKDCIKTRTKSYKKMKKEKENANKKLLKQVQDERIKIVKAEQALLKKKLNDLKKGRTSVDYSDEETRQERMREALRELAKKSNASDPDKHFSINMFL
jgi:hypothetical protein